MSDYIVAGGGGFGILAFIVAMFKIYSSDKIWKALFQELRQELKECRTEREKERINRERERGEWQGEKATLDTRIAGMQSEIITLRREVHADRWLQRKDE